MSAMNEEDLYQIAKNELNSRNRIPGLWARACALATDDVDEARYLYTNLRVEQLAAEKDIDLVALKARASDSKLLNTDDLLQKPSESPLLSTTIELDASQLSAISDNSAENNESWVKQDVTSDINALNADDLANFHADESALDTTNLEEQNLTPAQIALRRIQQVDVEAQTSNSSAASAASAAELFEAMDTEASTTEVGEAKSNYTDIAAAGSSLQLDDNSLAPNVSSTQSELPAPSELNNQELNTPKPNTPELSIAELNTPEIASPKLNFPTDTSSSNELTLDAEFLIPKLHVIEPSKADSLETNDPDPQTLDVASADLEPPALSLVDAPELEKPSPAASSASNLVNEPSQEGADGLSLDTPGLSLQEVAAMIAGGSPNSDTEAAAPNKQAEFGDASGLDETDEFSAKSNAETTNEASKLTADTSDEDSATQRIEATIASLQEPDTEFDNTVHLDNVSPPVTESDEATASASFESHGPSSDSTTNKFKPNTKNQTVDLRGPDSNNSLLTDSASELARKTESKASAKAEIKLKSQEHKAGKKALKDQQTRDTNHTSSGRVRGTHYSIFKHPSGRLKAVKEGFNWFALAFTLPWLLARGLLGTGLVYAVMWAILLVGLVATGLQYLDHSGFSSTGHMIVMAVFVLLAFAGLLYLPLRYANSWYADKLRNGGYEKLKSVPANSKKKALKHYKITINALKNTSAGAKKNL